MDKCTIILRTHNRFAYTKWTLESVKKYTNWEYVDEFLVGDAESVDGTLELLESYDFVDKIYHVPAGNIGINLRKGAELAKNKYVIVLDNDLLVSQDWDLKAYLAIQEGKKHGLNIIAYHLASDSIKQRGRPIPFEYGILIPVQAVGGLVITTKELLLSENDIGKLGEYNNSEYKEHEKYMSWWIWHQFFINQIALLYPDPMCLLIEYGDKLPERYAFQKERLNDSLVKAALKEDPIGLKQLYIQNKWMRYFPLR